MRNVDSSYTATLQNARELGIVPRTLVSITSKSFADGSTVVSNFWTGDETETITVFSIVAGEDVARQFVGGVNLYIDSIPRVSDLTIQTVSIGFSQIAAPVQNAIRGTNVRLAKVEVWEALFDPKNRQLVSKPPLTFLGEINGAPVETPEDGGEGSIEINCVSDAISMLTRKNPQKSSDAAQSRRSGDEFGKYSGVVKTWRVEWGQK
jgi:hypothetical protein